MPGPSLDPACAASSEIARFAPCLAMSLKRLVARHAAADAAAAAEATRIEEERSKAEERANEERLRKIFTEELTRYEDYVEEQLLLMIEQMKVEELSEEYEDILRLFNSEIKNEIENADKCVAAEDQFNPLNDIKPVPWKKGDSLEEDNEDDDY